MHPFDLTLGASNNLHGAPVSVQDFTIDKVSWHTQVVGNPESAQDVQKRFKVLVGFLQAHNLTTRVLLSAGEVPDEEFSLEKSDLTEEGFQVIKAGYDKWLKRVINKRKDPRDLQILETALERIRGLRKREKEREKVSGPESA